MPWSWVSLVRAVGELGDYIQRDGGHVLSMQQREDPERCMKKIRKITAGAKADPGNNGDRRLQPPRGRSASAPTGIFRKSTPECRNRSAEPRVWRCPALQFIPHERQPIISWGPCQLGDL